MNNNQRLSAQDKAELILLYKQPLLQTFEYLEKIQENKRFLDFPPFENTQNYRNRLMQADNEVQNVMKIYLKQNEEIKNLIVNNAEMIQNLNKKFIFYEQAITELECQAK